MVAVGGGEGGEGGWKWRAHAFDERVRGGVATEVATARHHDWGRVGLLAGAVLQRAPPRVTSRVVLQRRCWTGDATCPLEKREWNELLAPGSGGGS